MDFYKSPRGPIIGAMRNSFSRGAIAKEVRRRAISNETGPRGGIMQVCAECGKSFPPKEIQVDHIETVVPLDMATDSISLDEYWSRLNCKKHWSDAEVNFNNLQALCANCHKDKTNFEKEIRKTNRKKRKDELSMRNSDDKTGKKKRKTKV